MNADKINLVTIPSTQTIQATFGEISIYSKMIKKEIGELLVTLKAIDDVLDIVNNSTNIGYQFRSLNPITWSVPATAKLLIRVISQYVSKITGISFTDWINFIKSILEKFQNYTNQLDNINKISRKYSETLPTNDLLQEDIKNDEIFLLDIKSETETWKNYISQVAKLSVLLDAITQAQTETEKQVAKNLNDEGVLGEFKKIWRTIIDKTDLITKNKTSEIQDQVIKWFFSSIYDLKSQTRNFNNQTRDLIPKLSNLANLLELEIAQIRLYSGKISEEEASLLSTRVAATITMPQLISKINTCQVSLSEYGNLLLKLEEEFKKNNIPSKTYLLLLQEYNTNIKQTRELLDQYSAQAGIWKKEGLKVINDRINWAKSELEIVRARKLLGQITIEELKKRSRLLNDEIRRLEEAKNSLNFL